MVVIIRNTNSCKIIDEENIEIFNALDRELSFKIQGAEFSAAYKGYFNDSGDFITWDGRRHLMSSIGRFPSGLLPRVIDFFNNRNINPTIIDERPKLVKAPEINILDTLKELNKIPREYQIEAMEKATQTDCGIIRLATGGGKTLVSALITAKIGKPTLILVIGKDLLYQTKSFFETIFKQDIGIIGDGKCEIHNINIATIWSIGNALGMKQQSSIDDLKLSEKKIDISKHKDIREMLVTAKTIILDECHLAACDTVQIISKNIKAEYIYGMSASPWRDDGGDLLIEAFLGRKVIDISARSLINKGYLVEPHIRFLAPIPYKFNSGKYQKIYTNYIVQNKQRNEMIIKGALKMVDQGFVPLILFHSIKHGDILFKQLKNKTSVALLSGKDNSKVREDIKNKLESGEIKCILASKIFDIGVDLPILSGLIIAGGGKSSVRALQRIGRVIRPYSGKNISAVIDFADQAPYLKDHAEARAKIYKTEFNVTWPQKRKE